MVRLFRTLGQYIPVTAQSNQTSTNQRAPADPEVGARWGKMAQFEFSTQGIASGGGLQVKLPWVEIIENNDNPPRRRKDISAGLNISRKLGHIFTECRDWAPVRNRVWYYVPSSWSLEWTETLPKKYLGQLGSPTRRTLFRMSNASEVLG
jgi:hypothetical protein